MAAKPTSGSAAKNASTREDRLKAALKANLARRKAQTRERARHEGSHEDTPGATGQDKDR